MATGTRSRRTAAPPPPAPQPVSRPETRSRGARITRQTTVPPSIISEERQPDVRRTQRQRDPGFPAARRGARPNTRGQSVASIATVPAREDETEFGEDSEEEDEAQSELAQGEGGDVEFDLAGDESSSNRDKIRWQIMKLSLPDLAKASDDLMKLLKAPQYEYPVFRGLHELKLRALEGYREVYEEPDTAPLIDWIQLIDVYDNADDAAPAVAVMARANIATIFNELCEVEADKRNNALPVLRRLNDSFPSFFIPAWDSHPDPQLTLDIRTSYLIFTLAHEPKNINPFAIIADIFCENVKGKDYPRYFTHGPFKKLWDGDQVDENTDLLIADRIKVIVTAIHAEKATYGVRALYERFPFEDLQERLKEWFFKVYAMLSEPGNARDYDIPLDGVEDVADSQADFAESQPIVRTGTGEVIASLFDGEASIEQLHGRGKGKAPIPPSNQNQAVPPPGAPRDYPAHTNDDLLSTPQPDVPRSSQPAPQPSARRGTRGKRKRKRIEPIPEEEQEEAEEEEDDNAFETDTRPVDKGKRKAIEATLPSPKRARPTVSSTAPVVGSAPAAESAIPPSTDPSQADLQRVRAAKDIIAKRARLAQTQNFKQRYPWSDSDTATLIGLIRERHAAWAVMQSLDSHRFEHPRNQQAYRDKARNLKVDYLITDANLPPCFDLVALGRKEIDRLRALGKNPWRKEEDVDADGRPIGVDHEEQALEAES